MAEGPPEPSEPIDPPPTDPPPVDEPPTPTPPKPVVPPQPGPPTVPPSDWKPPTKAEADTMARELRIAVKEAKDRKARIAELEAAQATDAERAVMEARQSAAAERDAAWKPAVVTARAEAALASAGCTDPERQELMLRLIDQTVVELDDRGKVVGGLAEQVALIKEKFADAFSTARPAVPSARDVNAGDKKPPPVKLSTSQQLAANLGVKPT